MSGAVLLLHSASRPSVVTVQAVPRTEWVARAPWLATEWFASIKSSCNAVEVEMRHQQMPPPRTTAGAGYSAACYALAGKIDRAHDVIERLPRDQRAAAAGIVFNVGHPVADAGDDESAGPIMEFVLEYVPNNYMARYHAGMSAYALGRRAAARIHLREFLRLYPADDGWRTNAIQVLTKLDADVQRS